MLGNNLRAVSTVQVVNNVTTSAITTAEEIVFMNVRDRRMNNQSMVFLQMVQDVELL